MIRNKAHRPRLPARLRGDTSGATLLEFAFVGPVLVLMIMGLFDVAHSQYTLSVLQGAIQKAGRDLALESGSVNEGDIDDYLTEQVKAVVPSNAEVTITKESFFDFNDVGRAEPFTDGSNADGKCNANEPYIDVNGNGRFDNSRGTDGLGTARDAVLYTATVSYPRLFPMYGLAGLPQDASLSGTTVLRNQPFDEQAGRGATQRNCNP